MDPVAAFKEKGRETGNRRQVSKGTRVRACLQQLHNNPEGKGGAEERRMGGLGAGGLLTRETTNARSGRERRPWWSYRDFMLRVSSIIQTVYALRSDMAERKLQVWWVGGISRGNPKS